MVSASGRVTVPEALSPSAPPDSPSAWELPSAEPSVSSCADELSSAEDVSFPPLLSWESLPPQPVSAESERTVVNISAITFLNFITSSLLSCAGPHIGRILSWFRLLPFDSVPQVCVQQGNSTHRHVRIYLHYIFCTFFRQETLLQCHRLNK